MSRRNFKGSQSWTSLVLGRATARAQRISFGHSAPSSMALNMIARRSKASTGSSRSSAGSQPSGPAEVVGPALATAHKARPLGPPATKSIGILLVGTAVATEDGVPRAPHNLLDPDRIANDDPLVAKKGKSFRDEVLEGAIDSRARPRTCIQLPLGVLTPGRNCSRLVLVKASANPSGGSLACEKGSPRQSSWVQHPIIRLVTQLVNLAFGSASSNKPDSGLRQNPCLILASGLRPDSELVQPPEGLELLPALGVVCSLMHGFLPLIGVGAVGRATLLHSLPTPQISLWVLLGSQERTLPRRLDSLAPHAPGLVDLATANSSPKIATNTCHGLYDGTSDICFLLFLALAVQLHDGFRNLEPAYGTHLPREVETGPDGPARVINLVLRDVNALEPRSHGAVSYTHLTLPTICSV
eukprot:15447447-Alexandrium_andersonii.AAC.2